MPRLSLILAPLVLTFSGRLDAQGQSTPKRAAPGPESARKPVAAARQTVTHRGFRIDVTEVASAADRDSVVKAVKEQLDLVADASMPVAARTFFRGVPIVMQSGSGRARYGERRI